MTQLGLAILWWLLLLALGIAMAPLINNVARGNQYLSKVLALAILTYLTWLPSTVFPIYGWKLVVASIAFIILLGAILARRTNRGWTRDYLEVESVFIVVYVLFLLFFLHKPDIYPAACEDFMNYAFIQSILRSAGMPPLDPWLAGEQLSYYYFGHLMTADLVLASGVPPNVAYNLGAATIPALTASCAYGLGKTVRNRLAGALAGLLVVFTGLLSGLYQLLAYLFPWTTQVTGWTAKPAPNLWEWATHMNFHDIMVIPRTFNFYPFHGFTHGNLHAGLMSIPFQAALIGLTYAYIRKPRGGLLLGVWGLVLGFTIGLNTWEYPTYLLLALLATIGRARHWIIVASVSLVLYLPFFLTGSPGGYRGLALVENHTTIPQFLSIFPLPAFTAYTYLLLRLKPILRREEWLYPLIFSLLVFGVGWFVGGPVFALLAPMIILSMVFFHWSGKPDLVVVLLVLGALVAMECEVINVRDAMSWPRFNTVMKFHMQTWVIWGVAAGVAAPKILERVRHPRVKTLWAVAFTLVLLGTLVHPLLTVSVLTSPDNRFAQSSVRGTLDGTMYLQTYHPGDAGAIEWLNENIEGQPIILEAPCPAAYTYEGRVSTMTGLPTLVGWRSHEVEWHANTTPVDKRYQAAQRIYMTRSFEEADRLLEEYGVEYIYVGGVEKDRYPPESLAKFQRYPVAYQDNGVTIYERTTG